VSGTDEGNQADPMITGVVNGPGLDKGSVYSIMGVAEANVAGTGACFALVLPPWSHTINKDLPLPTIVIWNDSEKRFDNSNATVAQYVVCVQELIRDIIGTGKQEEDWELPVENSIQSNSRVLTDSALFSVFVALYLDSFDEDNVDPTLLTKETSGLNSYCRTRHSITTAELQAVRLLLIAKAKRLKGFATDLEKSGTITKANWMGGFADKLLISLISGRKLVSVTWQAMQISSLHCRQISRFSMQPRKANTFYPLQICNLMSKTGNFTLIEMRPWCEILVQD
jgi:hypothetical protein